MSLIKKIAKKVAFREPIMDIANAIPATGVVATLKHKNIKKENMVSVGKKINFPRKMLNR